MIFFAWFVSILVVSLLVAWLLYIFGTQNLDSTHRPEVTAYDRFGQSVGKIKNPDYHLNPGKEHHPPANVELARRLRKTNQP